MQVRLTKDEAVLTELNFDDEREIYIGTDADCAIQLPDEQPGDRIAVIAPTGDGSWHIENLDSQTPIQLNGHSLTEQAPLNDGDAVQMGDYVVQIALTHTVEDQATEESRLGVEELAKIRRFPLPVGSIVKRSFEGVTVNREKLDKASEMGLAIARCRDIHELVDTCLGLLTTHFDARVSWIGMRRKSHGELEVIGGRLPSGGSCGSTPLVELLLYRCCERGQHVCIRKVRDQAEIGSAMAVPISAGQNIFGMLYVDRATRVRRFQIPELDVLTAFASTVATKAKALLTDMAEREQAISDSEISVVQKLQTLLDPKDAPVIKGFKFAAYSRSGQEMPGDVYDVMRRPDTQLTAMVLGHVRQQGAALALSMARLQATFRVAMLHNDPPHAFARAMNWILHEHEDSSIIDMMCILIDGPSGKINYVRAGKIGAFVVDPAGQPRKLPTADGPSLGASPDYQYASNIDQLAPGETLAVYTRGVATALNAEGQRFGETHFIELICDGFGQPPSATTQDLSDEMAHFLKHGSHPHDMTVLLLHRRQ